MHGLIWALRSSYVLNRISFWYKFKIYHNMMWMYFTIEIIMIYDYHSQMLKIGNVLKDFFSDEVDFVFVQISGNKRNKRIIDLSIYRLLDWFSNENVRFDLFD